jgi:hypothetical protein
MSSSNFGSHMQTLVLTQKIDQLEQEVLELRGEVTTLWAEVEKLTSLVSSLMAAKDPPLVQQRSQSLCQPMCMKRPRQQVPQQPQSFTTQNQAPQQLIIQNQARKVSQFDPIPIKYVDLLPMLLKKKLVQTRPLHQVPNPLPSWYCPELKCDFHQGAPGHDTEQCYPLKEEVQKLIENNTGFFEDPDIKVLLQQQHLVTHSIAVVRPITNVVQNPGYQPQFQQYQQQPRKRAPRTKFDPIPMKYAELLPILLEKNLVQTMMPPPVLKRLPARFRADLSCDFHQGALGHDVEHCYALKNAVQDLFEADLLPF